MRKVARVANGMEVEVEDNNHLADASTQVQADAGSGSPQGTNQFPKESDDSLPPWFGKMKSSLLEGVDGLFDRKILPIQKDIKDIKEQAGRAETIALEAKASVEELRKELSENPRLHHLLLMKLCTSACRTLRIGLGRAFIFLESRTLPLIPW